MNNYSNTLQNGFNFSKQLKNHFISRNYLLSVNQL